MAERSPSVRGHGPGPGERAARARAYALLAACGAVIRADRRLSGTVGDSHISTHALRQVQTPDGTVATVTFGVACDTFTGT